MKVKECVWYSTLKGSFGLIAAENEQGETKFYLGMADGYNEETDITNIIDWGTKIDPDYVIKFIKRNQIEP